VDAKDEFQSQHEFGVADEPALSLNQLVSGESIYSEVNLTAAEKAAEGAKKHRRKGKPVRASVEDSEDNRCNSHDELHDGNRLSNRNCCICPKQAEKRSLKSTTEPSIKVDDVNCSGQRQFPVSTIDAVFPTSSESIKRSRLSDIIEKCRLQKRSLVLNGGQVSSVRPNRYRSCKTDSNGNAVVVKPSCCKTCKRRFVSVTALVSHQLLRHRRKCTAAAKSLSRHTL
jgi:hypothetical protein